MSGARGRRSFHGYSERNDQKRIERPRSLRGTASQESTEELQIFPAPAAERIRSFRQHPLESQAEKDPLLAENSDEEGEDKIVPGRKLPASQPIPVGSVPPTNSPTTLNSLEQRATITLNDKIHEVPLHLEKTGSKEELIGSLNTSRVRFNISIPVAQAPTEEAIQIQRDVEHGNDEDIFSGDPTLAPIQTPVIAEGTQSNFFVRNGKRLLLSGGALLTSAPAGINALLSGLKIPASELGPKAWKEATTESKILAGILMTATLVLNFILAIASLPAAMATLFNRETWRDNPFRSAFALFFGLAGALSLFAVGMQSMAFSETWAIGMAGSAFLINFATRLVSANGSLKRSQEQLFDKDVKLQQAYVKRLKRIKPELRQQLNRDLFNDAVQLKRFRSNPQGFYARLLYRLDQKLSARSNRHDLEDGPIQNGIFTEANAQALVEGTVDYSLGITLALTAYIIFELKGENAIKILHDGLLNNSPDLVRGLIGTPSGIASALLYLLSSMDFRAVLSAAISAAITSKKMPQYVLLATLMAGIFLSGANMFNVSKSAEQDKDGIFYDLINTVPHIFPWIGGLGGALVNGKAALMEFFKPNAPVKFKEGNDIIGQIIQVYENTGLRLHQNIVNNKFPKAFTQHLQTESVFARKQKLVTPNESDQQPKMTRNKSFYPLS